jgi:UDPglucose 6-dehydrogenase
MNISVIGSGYVGLVTAVCLADLGNVVVCMDVDQKRIDRLNAGDMPIYEPGLAELIERNRYAGRLTFTASDAMAIAHAPMLIIAVGTPSAADGSADLQYVEAAAANIARHMEDEKVIVVKSTVPVGTCDRVARLVREGLIARGMTGTEFSVVSNPEFLKEGAAVEDFMRPDRIVVGVADDEPGQRARELMRRLYAPFNRHHERSRYMDVRSAELTKYAANAMLATRISFMNELANMADSVGADIEMIRQGIGSDTRIGYGFLYAGTGYGGSCFPKDVQALIRSAADNGLQMQILKAVDEVNDSQKTVLVRKVLARLGPDLRDKTFAVWGLAFKPNTDDMREAPSRPIIAELLRQGARVQAHDPVAMPEAARCFAQDLSGEPHLLDRFTMVTTPALALKGADALLIITEWKAFKSPDFDALKNDLSMPLVFDGRNLYDPASMLALGIEYIGVGRQTGHSVEPAQKPLPTELAPKALET